MKVLFLDFDGVLHSHFDSDASLWTFLPRLESVLREFAGVSVVVTSSWGDRRSIDELRRFFSPDIAPRVVEKVRTERRRIKPHGERGEACARFCRRHQLRAGEWVAIDDTPSLFRKTDPLIYCVNGFREAQELQLRMVLAHEVPAWRLALETIDYLFGTVFDCDTSRTRDYVLRHRLETADGQTFAQLFFARRRRAIEKLVILMDKERPQTSRLTDAEMIERHGYAPEQLRGRGWRSRK